MQTLRLPAAVVLTLAVIALLGSVLTIIGSDALWLSALGDHIRAGRSVPVGIPFAAAESADWVNTTVLGQLLFSLAHSQGSIGVVILQILVVMATLLVVALEANSLQARPHGTTVALLAVAVGAAAPLLIARAQLLSLVPFAVLLVLLRRDQVRPSAQIWWTVPLIALWSNLHGAVLAGVAVLGCYLLLSRVRVSPVTAIGVGLSSLAATCLNPGLLEAPRYYAGVLGGEATNDDSGMWGRLDLTNPFDLLLMVAAVAMVTMAARRRLPLWEYAAGLGLLVATASAVRHGVWLLLFLAVPAATATNRARVASALTSRISSPASVSPAALRAVPASLAVIGVLSVAAVLTLRAPSFQAADAQAAHIAETTRGQVVLVAEPLAESLAVAGATVWASNPLDAFAPADQAAYLAFVNGDAVGARRAFEGADVVVALPDSPQSRAALAAGYTRYANVAPYVVLRRTSAI